MTADSTLAGRIEAIIKARGATASAAKEIEALLKSEQRLVDKKNAPAELGISERQFYRWLKAGRLTVEMVAGRAMIDVSKMSVRAG
jgi:predicted DNA-binding protein (UPF0251 family)